MKIIGNIVWLVFGGIFIAMEYMLVSIILFITIIGIPFGIQTIKLAIVALWPFGRKIQISTTNKACLSTIMNIIWLLFGGLLICLSHLLIGLIFYITIIGIPFGNQHMKLARLCLTPFGASIQ